MQASIDHPRDLQAAYPYQFAKPLREAAFEFARGWLPIVASACSEFDALVSADKYQHRFHWIQIKEKFGTLRLYWGARAMRGMRIDVLKPTGVASLIPKPHGKGRDGAVATRIAQIVREAEQRSAHACIVCGAPGVVRPGGWVLTLCDAHAAQRERGEELVYWFED
jgi:hypothetical protein